MPSAPSSPLTALAVLALGCSSPAATQRTVLLISWDTTRADGLSSYADELPWRSDDPLAPAPSTPVADGLAADGVRFQWALSPAPTTLSAHTAAFSGLDSHGHRVVRNGFALPRGLDLLAPRLQAAGWDTIGVVGAYALEARTGIGQGFRQWVDHREPGTKAEYYVRGEQVVDHALQAVDQRTDAERNKPLFLFVHLYDVHMPWLTADAATRARFVDPTYQGKVDGGPPSIGFLYRQATARTLSDADARQARALYLSQVAWADMLTGRLIDGLRERGLLDQALIGLMSDHGEVLDADPDQAFAYSHGFDVDLDALHVPLILSGTGDWEGRPPAGQVVAEPVRLQDLGSTLLGRLGMPTALGQGRDLAAAWDGRGLLPATLFAEAQMPHATTSATSWNNLPLERGVLMDGLLLLRPMGGRPDQLYRMDNEQTPLPADGDVLSRMGAALTAWDATAPAHRSNASVDAESQEALKALGYVDR
jgi:arylsulfatase A-like enzyme